tara:strand:- start:2446 stop:2676 length:231 start_codon:yes stop_codon:yes gene_type:complete
MITNVKGDYMPKNRIFKFTDGEEIKEVTALGWKKAVKSFQGGAKATSTVVSWIGKKGKEMTKSIKLPIGRSKKIGK